MLGSDEKSDYQVIALNIHGKNLWRHLTRHWRRWATSCFPACYNTLTK